MDIHQAIRQSALGQTTFFDNSLFPWTKQVEALWGGIREEADRVLDASVHLPGFEDISEDQRLLTTDKRWKIFPFLLYGHTIPETQACCPITAEALQLIPGITTAFFSILHAGKELPAHVGPSNGVLRYHLGVTVPEPEQCGLTIGTETRHWVEGKSMIFDDSFFHSAYNRGTSDRIVLFVDFMRPGLPVTLDRENHRVIDEIAQSHFIQHALRNWGQWQRDTGREFRDAMRQGSSTPPSTDK